MTSPSLPPVGTGSQNQTDTGLRYYRCVPPDGFARRICRLAAACTGGEGILVVKHGSGNWETLGGSSPDVSIPTEVLEEITSSRECRFLSPSEVLELAGEEEGGKQLGETSVAGVPLGGDSSPSNGDSKDIVLGNSGPSRAGLLVLNPSPDLSTEDLETVLSDLAATIRGGTSEPDILLDPQGPSTAVLDGEGTILTVNRQWRRFAVQNGAAADEWIGTNYFASFQEDGRGNEGASTARAGIQHVLHGERRSFEMTYPCHCSHQKRWFRMRVERLDHPRAKALVAHENITPSKEEPVHTSILTTALNEANEGILVLLGGGASHRDTAARVLYANRQFIETTGYSLQQVIGEPLALLHGPETDPAVLDQIDTAFENTSPLEAETVHYRKDGSNFVGSFSLAPVFEEDEGLTYWVWIQRDVTKEHRLSERLRRHRQKVSALYAAIGDLLEARSADQVVDQVETLVADTMGLPFYVVRLRQGEQLVPACVAESLSTNSPLPAYDVEQDHAVAQALRTGEPEILGREELADVPHTDDTESVGLFPMGQRGLLKVGFHESEAVEPFDLHLLEILSQNAGLVLERVRREEKLAKAREQAEEASELKSSLLHNMSHEIRTPLTSIIGFAEVLEQVEDERMGRLAHLVRRGSERLHNTLNRVLEYSELEAGAVELRPRLVDLQMQVSAIIDSFRHEAEQRGVELTLTGGPTRLQLQVDEDGLQEVLRNILDNALKFTESGGEVNVRVRTEVASDDPSADDTPGVVIEVEDTGAGMSREFLSKAFNAFTQESTGYTRTHEGIGLGLSVAKRYVDLMGGSIDIRSTKGKGTVITVYFPREQVMTTDPENRDNTFGA